MLSGCKLFHTRSTCSKRRVSEVAQASIAAHCSPGRLDQDSLSPDVGTIYLHCYILGEKMMNQLTFYQIGVHRPSANVKFPPLRALHPYSFITDLSST